MRAVRGTVGLSLKRGVCLFCKLNATFNKFTIFLLDSIVILRLCDANMTHQPTSIFPTCVELGLPIRCQ